MPPEDQIARGRRRLERLWRAGTALLGSELALMGGAMTWVSEHRLVAALSNAGGFGVIACGAMAPDQLAAEIALTQELTARPFGVNLIIMHPQLQALIDVCGAQRVSHVVLAGGLPDRAAIARVKDGGARLLCFVPSLAVGKRLARGGADALIIEGMEAGGHIGPVATGVLAQEILPHLREVPVFVAGGIGHGEAIAAYLRMGAAGCQLGTRFVCATESIAHPRFKEAFIRASARDATPSVQIDPDFKVIPVRALANQATRAFAETQIDVIARHRRGELSYEEAGLAIEHFWAGALRRAVIDGDVEHGSLMAGQSVGLVRSVQPIAEILAELIEQTALALGRDEWPEPTSVETAA
ncbi:MAG: NAD(P)H-dependent flavin oxidoreductase [Geminicoccaceae bacterium]